MIAALLLALLPAARAVDAPPPLYLDEQRALLVLWQASPSFDRCVPEGRDELPPLYLELRVEPDGSVSSARLREPGSGQPELDTCLLDAARALHFPAHHEEPLELGYTLAWVQGGFRHYPAIQFPERPISPLFLYLPGDLPPETRRALESSGIPLERRPGPLGPPLPAPPRGNPEPEDAAGP